MLLEFRRCLIPHGLVWLLSPSTLPTGDLTMLKRALVLLTSIVIFSFSCSILATPPENLATLKKQVTEYYQTGAFEHDVAQAVFPAKQYLKKRVKNNTDNQKLAVVFDIDDTCVTHYKDLKKIDYGQTSAYIFNVILQHVTNSPIKPVRELFNYAKAHHVAIFLITGRPQADSSVTKKLLKASGYTGWTKLYLTPRGYHEKSAAYFKTAVRKQLTNAGYDIVLNLGDQVSDLTGGYADMTVKVPNPLYFVP